MRKLRQKLLGIFCMTRTSAIALASTLQNCCHFQWLAMTFCTFEIFHTAAIKIQKDHYEFQTFFTNTSEKN